MVSDSQQSFLRELITVRSREVIAAVLRHASSLPRHGRNEERLFVRDGILPELDPQFETAVTRLQPSSHKRRRPSVRSWSPFGDIALNLLKDLVK